MAKVIGSFTGGFVGIDDLLGILGAEGRSFIASGSAFTIRSYKSLETVMALPLRSMENAVIVALGKAPTPRLAAMGMPANMCAPSSSPMATLSRILAQDASLGQRHVQAIFLEITFSAATTNGAQSVRGINPRVSLVFQTTAFAGPSARPQPRWRPAQQRWRRQTRAHRF